MFAELIIKAGVGWMLPILLLSWLALTLVIERGGFWFALRRHRATRGLLAQVAEGADAGDLPRGCPLAAPALAYLNARAAGAPAPLAREQGEGALGRLDDACRQGLGLLSVIANLAGTLGLLGTVAGVSMSFEQLANDDPKGLALSLSTAMYTTLGGILLFILSYVAVYVFGNMADALEELQERALGSLALRDGVAGGDAEQTLEALPAADSAADLASVNRGFAELADPPEPPATDALEDDDTVDDEPDYVLPRGATARPRAGADEPTRRLEREAGDERGAA